MAPEQSTQVMPKQMAKCCAEALNRAQGKALRCRLLRALLESCCDNLTGWDVSRK